MTKQHAPPSALVILAEGAEEMEVTITVDVLRRGGVEVVLAGLVGTEPVECSRGVRLVPDAALSECADRVFNVVILPGGGPGTDALCAAAEVGELLRAQERAGRSVAAVCAAPKALAVHGIAAGKPMTAHPSVRDAVAAHGAWSDARVTKAEGLITSQGPGTAFEFALALVADLVDEETANGLRAPMILA